MLTLLIILFLIIVIGLNLNTTICNKQLTDKEYINHSLDVSPT